MARLNLGAGAAATITNVTGGSIVGTNSTSTVTTPNQITGGEAANVTWLSIPTNTSSTLHNIDFGSNVFLELTNSGSVAFAATSSGSVSVSRGPANTAVSNIYDATVGSEDHFSITSTRTTTNVGDNVEQAYEIVSGGTTISDGAITGISSAVSGATLAGGARYHYVTNSDDSITLYKIGTEQPLAQTIASDTADGVTTFTTVDFYSLKIETKADTATLTLGGLTLSNSGLPAVDNGVNFTDNVEVQEKPFTLTVNFPEDYGYAAVELPDGTQRNTQVSNSYDNITNFFSITSDSAGDEQSFAITSAESADIPNTAILDLKGINRTGSDDRYYQDGGLIYRIGAEQTADESTDGTTGDVTVFYALIEERNAIVLDQIDLTALDTLKVAAVKVGLAPFFGSFVVTGDDQVINVTPEVQDYSRTAIIPAGTAINETEIIQDIGLTLGGTVVTGDVSTVIIASKVFSVTALARQLSRVTVDLTFVDNTPGTVTINVNGTDFSTTEVSSRIATRNALVSLITADTEGRFSTSVFDGDLIITNRGNNSGDINATFDAGTTTFTAEIENIQSYIAASTLATLAADLASDIDASGSFVSSSNGALITIRPVTGGLNFSRTFSSVLSGGGTGGITGSYSDTPTGSTTGLVFDTSNRISVNCANVRQESNLMNKLLTESLFGHIYGSVTVEALLYHSSVDIYRTNNDAMFINSGRMALTSSTASAAGTKETMAYFTPTNAASSADVESRLYLLTEDDDFLGQSIIRSDFTTLDLTNELNRRKVTEGTLLNAQLSIPVFGSDQ